MRLVLLLFVVHVSGLLTLPWWFIAAPIWGQMLYAVVRDFVARRRYLARIPA